MNIIIEGVDATGKSVLADHLSSRLFRPIQHSEGPPKTDDEINSRARRYLSLDGFIFDRHPCVSNNFYDKYRNPHKLVQLDLIEIFYKQPNLFIYCDPNGYDHQVKDYDTPEHLRLIELNYNDLLCTYRMWSTRHAHIMYRIGDSMENILLMCRACLIK